MSDFRPNHPARRPVNLARVAMVGCLALLPLLILTLGAAEPIIWRLPTATPSGPAARADPTETRIWLNLLRSDPTRGQLRLRLEPPPGFHLYGLDLPVGGVDGVGRPTVFQLSPPLTAIGPVHPNRQTSDLIVAGLSRPVPVFPTGVLVLRQEVRLPPAGLDRVQVTISYAACSPSVCLPPVGPLALSFALG
jgi:hypothetical protein